MMPLPGYKYPDRSNRFFSHFGEVWLSLRPHGKCRRRDDNPDLVLACLVSAQPSANNIVRCYRELPSPLVRDSVAGWRTGRLDQVLGGDFDLMS